MLRVCCHEPLSGMLRCCPSKFPTQCFKRSLQSRVTLDRLKHKFWVLSSGSLLFVCITACYVSINTKTQYLHLIPDLHNYPTISCHTALWHFWWQTPNIYWFCHSSTFEIITNLRILVVCFQTHLLAPSVQVIRHDLHPWIVPLIGGFCRRRQQLVLFLLIWGAYLCVLAAEWTSPCRPENNTEHSRLTKWNFGGKWLLTFWRWL